MKAFNRAQGGHCARQLDAHPDYRVLRRLASRREFALTAERPQVKDVPR